MDHSSSPSTTRPAGVLPPGRSRDGAGERTLVCASWGGAGRTRDEAADLVVAWLVDATISGLAATPWFHQACCPAGIPGELSCAGCGDAPLLDPALTAAVTGDHGPVDLFTAAAFTGWRGDQNRPGGPRLAAAFAGELEDRDAGEGPRRPACSRRPARARRVAAAGAAR